MNYGFKKEELKSEDHVFGASTPFPQINQSANWKAWLPEPETQNRNGIDPQCCVSEATSNVVETLIRFQAGTIRNFSDRFLAKISGTDVKNGNSPQAVAQAWRDNGCANEIDWPFDSTVKTLYDFYISIPSWIKTLALAINAEYELKYKYVPPTPDAIKEALKCSPLTFSTYAWVKDGDYYYKPTTALDNHDVMLFGYKEGEYWEVFDSYLNDGTTIKRIKWDSLPEVVYVYQISRKIVNEKSWIEFITNFIKAVFGL